MGERRVAQLPVIMTKTEQDGFQKLQVFAMAKPTRLYS